METWQKHEIRPHQGTGPAFVALPGEALPMPVEPQDSRDVDAYVSRMRRIRDREAGRAVNEPPTPVSIRGTVVTREETEEDKT